MSLEKIADKVVETDVLVIGGGVGGTPAAAKAAEHGLRVTLLEKSKVDRSGSASQGIDHYSGAPPKGMTPQDFLDFIEKYGKDTAYFGGVPYSDLTRLYRTVAARSWAIEELEKMGVTMRWDDGEFLDIDLTNHGGGTCLRVHWQDVKPQMAKAARERGVNIINRTMAIDLLTHNGAVTGATAIDTRTGEFLLIKAKAVVLATAACSRLYSPETPQPWNYKFRYHWCPASVSGDGWAMAYRAGAELANMEVSERGIRFRDDLTLSYGNTRGDGIEAKRFLWSGEEVRLAGKNAEGVFSLDYEDYEKSGRDPFYYSIDHLPEDFQKRMQVAFADERLVSFKIAEERGFNPATHWYEMQDSRPVQLNVPPGLNADPEFKTTVKGLYAIGDSLAGGHTVASASTSGLLVGDTIHEFINEADEPVIDEEEVQKQKEIALAPLLVKDGTEPMELECSIRYLCDRYIGVYKSEGRLKEGQRRLGTFRRVFLPKLMASNPHYLMRCNEVRNIIDVTEVHILACLERKETRTRFKRVEYPDRDPALDGVLLYSRLENNENVIEFRKPEPLNMDFREMR